MRKVIYETMSQGKLEIEYDETFPCKCCGFPVKHASMGGVDLCPWCDCGEERPEIKEARRVALATVRK